MGNLFNPWSDQLEDYYTNDFILWLKDSGYIMNYKRILVMTGEWG